MLDYVQQNAEEKMAERKSQQIKELQGQAFGAPITFKNNHDNSFSNIFSDYSNWK